MEGLGFVACVLWPALTCGMRSNHGDLMNLTRLSVGILWPLGNVSFFPESVGNSSNILLAVTYSGRESRGEWGSPLYL